MSFIYFFDLTTYTKAMFLAGGITVLLICLFFILPVLLLTVIQMRNFCLNKTTNERFSNKRAMTVASEGSMRGTSSMGASSTNSFEDY